jgi:FdrA protein
MAVFTKIEKNRYVDSLETLSMTADLNSQEGVEIGFASMAKASLKSDLEKNGMLTKEIANLEESDFVIVARCFTREAFDNAVCEILKEDKKQEKDKKSSYQDIEDAVKAHPEANLCQINVPGEYALEETTKALNAGLHCCVFSNNVPLEDEKKMKELAMEKGLLCMGPDCGVANINGAALVLASINNRGPFGICGASGTGIQHVAAILHECSAHFV